MWGLKLSNKKFHFNTNVVHAGYEKDPTTLSQFPPLYQTVAYYFKDTDHAAKLFSLEEDGNIYTRIGNPTVRFLEKKIAILEEGVDALAAASGQAAITIAILNICKNGEQIVSSSNIYGGTYNLFASTFSKLGVNTVFIDPNNISDFADEGHRSTGTRIDFQNIDDSIFHGKLNIY